MDDDLWSPPVSVPARPGWDVRYIGAEPRLSEVVQLYRELGFEVEIEILNPALCGGCKVCFEEGKGEPSKVVYVKETPGRYSCIGERGGDG